MNVGETTFNCSKDYSSHTLSRYNYGKSEVKKMDNYTKGVLTIIAICLVSITFQLSGTNVIQNAKAVLGDCGSHSNPCWVKVK